MDHHHPLHFMGYRIFIRLDIRLRHERWRIVEYPDSVPAVLSPYSTGELLDRYHRFCTRCYRIPDSYSPGMTPRTWDLGRLHYWCCHRFWASIYPPSGNLLCWLYSLLEPCKTIQSVEALHFDHFQDFSSVYYPHGDLGQGNPIVTKNLQVIQD